MPDPILELSFDFASMPAPRATRLGYWARAKNYVEWRKAVRMVTAAALHADGEALAYPFRFPVAVSMEFIGINPRSDVDNHVKAVLDALTGIVLSGDHAALVPAIAASSWQSKKSPPHFHVAIYRYEVPRTWTGDLVEIH